MARNITVSEARDEYRQHLTARGLAKNSVNNNVQVLNNWIRIVGDSKVRAIEPRMIDRFFGEGGWNPTTRNLYLSILRGFFAWCQRHQYMPRDVDPTDGWRNVKTEKKEGLWIPVTEFPALLDAAEGPRDRAIIAMGMFTFLRGSEISTLRVQDLDLERGTLEIWRHKTKQSDVLPVVTELAEEMDRWLSEYRRRQVFTLNPDWYLIPAKGPLPMAWDPHLGKLQPTGEESVLRPGTPMGKPYECVKRALRHLGYEVRGTGAHTLRRSGARALFDRLRSEGYDGALMRVSSMLGHADTKTTEIYLGLRIERQQRNELLSGKRMFPDLVTESATVTPLRKVESDG